MDGLWDKTRRVIGQIIELGLLLVALAIVLQILFGRDVGFITNDVVGNLIALIQQLGDNGLVGLIAGGIILWLFWVRQATGRTPIRWRTCTGPPCSRRPGTLVPGRFAFGPLPSPLEDAFRGAR